MGRKIPGFGGGIGIYPIGVTTETSTGYNPHIVLFFHVLNASFRPDPQAF